MTVGLTGIAALEAESRDRLAAKNTEIARLTADLSTAQEQLEVARKALDREKVYAILYEQLDLSEEVIIELAECGNLGQVADAIIALAALPSPADRG